MSHCPTSHTPRRWYQFSLRSMFVLVVVVSIPLAWVVYSLNWINQRHEWLETGRVVPVYLSMKQIGLRPGGPYGLWIFGERSEHMLDCKFEDLERTRQLFPETTVFYIEGARLMDRPPDDVGAWSVTRD